jgi:iron complex outermembrane receptor protein
MQLRMVNYKTTGLTSDRIPLLVNENYTFFNPKAGITYTLNAANSFYFSYARANREPNRDDFENNPDVQPEQLNDFELGWRYDSETFRINANTYFMLYNEQLVLTGNIDNVGNPIRTNSGGSYRIGLEIEAAVQLGKKFTLQPNVTFSSNKNEEFIASIDGELVNLGKTDISYAPELIFGNAFVFKPIPNLQMSLLSKYVGEQYMSNTEAAASKLDSYFVNDFNINYELSFKKDDGLKQPFLDTIVFTALVNNIFNVKYESNGYYYTYDDTWSNPPQVTTIEGAGFYPQATINFLLGMALKF